MIFRVLYSSVKKFSNIKIRPTLLKFKRMTCNGGGAFPNNFRYPTARRDESVVDDYHGTKIPDPYRYLEDPDNEETKAYVDKLNEISSPYLNGCQYRDSINKRLTQLWDYPKESAPHREGDNYFYYFNSGLQNQSVLYIKQKLDEDGKIFLDPNTLSDDGTTSISMSSFSKDGTLFAYGLSEKGSDWTSVYFKKVPSGENLPDKLEGLRYSSLAWTKDNKGVFYNRYPAQKNNNVGTNTKKNEFHTLYYHVLGTPQSDDIKCVEFLDHPEYMTGAQVTDDGCYLVCTVSKGCDPMNMLYYYELKDGIKGKLALKTLVGQFESKYDFIDNDGSVFIIMTDNNAPLFKLIQIDIREPAKEKWRTLVKEHEKAKLDEAWVVNKDKLVLNYMQDVKNLLKVHSTRNGNLLYEIPLNIGTVVQFSGKKEFSEVFYKFQSFLTPGVTYRCELTEKQPKPEEYGRIEVKDFDASKFETKQVFYSSKDGTKIPMYVMHKKDLQMDGQHPCILYGYGGFNIALLPSFSVSRVMFMQHFNGVYAIANIRGGSEYGEKWHTAAMKEKKQNVFDDFIAGAEYLIGQKYTSREKLAIEGGSNGGLLVAACANQRPDLFGCVLNQVGVLDMLRYHNFTIGEAWVPEFGSSKDPKDFQNLIKYSPLHNLSMPPTGYPAMILFTGDHDDRVVPLHSLKYIAQLYHVVNEQAEKQTKPLLIRVDTKAGHGAGKPTKKVIEELTDKYAFLVRVMDLNWSE